MIINDFEICPPSPVFRDVPLFTRFTTRKRA